jgi:aldehyde dehydrogenase (NAD+)
MYAFGNHQKKPLCGIACQNIIAEVIKENNLPEGIFV